MTDDLMKYCPECDEETAEYWDKRLQDYVRVCHNCQLVGFTIEQMQTLRPEKYGKKVEASDD